jgi:hypothetical protein
MMRIEKFASVGPIVAIHERELLLNSLESCSAIRAIFGTTKKRHSPPNQRPKVDAELPTSVH